MSHTDVVVQSVEVLLDADCDAAVRADWRLLEALGLRTPARHRTPATRPHVTLAVATRIPDAVEAALAALRPALPVPLMLGGLLTFGRGRAILARAITPGPELRDLQRAVTEIVAAAQRPPENMLPERWIPHVTLARGVNAAGLARARSELADMATPGGATALRRWDGTRRVEWILAGRAP